MLLLTLPPIEPRSRTDGALIVERIRSVAQGPAAHEVIFNSNPAAFNTNPAILAEDGAGMWTLSSNELAIRSWEGGVTLQTLWTPYSETEVGHRLPLTADQWGTYMRLVREGKIRVKAPKDKERPWLPRYFTMGTPVAGLSVDRFLVAVPSATGDPRRPYETLYTLIVPKSRPVFLNRVLFTSERLGRAVAFFPLTDVSGYILDAREIRDSNGSLKSSSFVSWRYAGTKLWKVPSGERGDPYRRFAGRSVRYGPWSRNEGAHLLYDPVRGRVVGHQEHENNRGNAPQRTVLYDVATGGATPLSPPPGFARFQPFFLGGELLATAWSGSAFYANTNTPVRTFLWRDGAWTDVGPVALEATSATGRIGLFRDVAPASAPLPAPSYFIGRLNSAAPLR